MTATSPWDEWSGGMPPEIGAGLNELRDLAHFARGDLVAELPTALKGQDATERALIVAFLARATTTVDSIAVMCEHGYGAQALMLTRPLHELMVDVGWIHLDRERANAMFVKRARFDQHRARQRQQQYPEALGEPKKGPLLPPEEVQELEKLFGRFGSNSWTGVSMHERWRAVEGLFEDSGVRRQLGYVHDVYQDISNAEIHPGPGLARLLRIDPRPDGTRMVQLSMGPEVALSYLAIFSAWFNYAWLLGLVLEHFELPDGELMALVKRGLAVANQLTEERVREASARGSGG